MRWIWLLIPLLGACTGAALPATPAAPTLTLIPATATFTPAPLLPTPTAPQRINPADVQPPPALTEEATTEDPLIAEMTALAKRRITNQTGTPAADIETVSVGLYVWQDASLGCPLPGATYPPAEVPGYRIVLEADGEAYIFHTSFIDMIRCDPGNEVLPVELAETEEADPTRDD